MARPIEATPIIKGKDAERFLKDFSKTKLTPKHKKHLDCCGVLYKNFIGKINFETL